MTTVLDYDARLRLSLQTLTECWGCEYWSRDEQAFAQAEGWALSVFEDEDRLVDRIGAMRRPGFHMFATDQEAVAYVVKRAEEGSPLHMRAMVLHAASVLKYGNA